MQGESETKEVAEVGEVTKGSREAWQRRQLLECCSFILSTGPSVTLLTMDKVLLGGGGVPILEGDWSCEDLETFQKRVLGEASVGSGGGEGRKGRRSRRGAQ